MNKTLTINLAGQVFHIEEDAYLELRNYLESLKMYFRHNEGFQEIIDDIEARMGEMFRQKLKANREVVVMDDVKEAMAAMGKPEDFAEVLDEGEQTAYDYSTETSKGRLYRNPDDRILSGVCGGLGAYFNTDPLWFRLLFVVFLFIPGPSVLVYIILWILIPEAKTPAQKLEMRREKVTISSIERSIKDEYGNFKKKVGDFNSSQYGMRGRQFMNSAADGASDFLRTFFVVVAKLIVIFAVIMASLAIFGLSIAALIGLFSTETEFFSLAQRLYDTTAHMAAHWVSIVIVALIPLLAIIYYGLRYLLKAKTGIRGMGITAVLVWLVAFGVMLYTSIDLGMAFKQRGELTEQVPLQPVFSDTLHLDLASIQQYRESNALTPIKIKELNNSGMVQISGGYNISLEIKRGDTVRMQMSKMSRGRNYASAEAAAQKINYEVQQNGNQFTFPPTLVIDENDPWRNQQVKLTLYIPEGKTLSIDPALSSFLDEHFVFSIWKETGEFSFHGKSGKNPRVLPGITFKMDSTGLVCLDCETFNVAAIKQKGYESKEIAVSDVIRKLYVQDNLKVIIEPSAQYRLNMYAKPGFLKDARARESGEKLYLEKGNDDWDHFNSTFLVLGIPELEKIHASGASWVEIIGQLEEVEEISLSGASYLKGKVNSNNLQIRLSGATKAEVAGKVNNLEVKASGNSNAELADLEAQNAIIRLSGSCVARVNVVNKLETKTSGASSVKNTNKNRKEVESL